ncbi:MAG: OmpA family protein, partial [Candidatus Cloacimonetes bacterium]|nr:OmpA family protein [Candidatus Cloacimonadota bacterium]
MKKTKYFLTVFLFSFLFLSAQDNMIQEIQLLRENLEDTYHEYIQAGITREVDLYPHALARIDLALQSLNEELESEKARNEFELVQFIIEAARIQMVAAKNYAISLDLQAETESILRDVNAIRDQIIQIEKELKELQTAKLNQQLKDAENRFRNIQNEMIVVNSDARGTIISMSDLLFEIGSAELTCELKTNLAKIAGILLIYKDLEILVEGHTDNIGSEE